MSDQELKPCPFCGSVEVFEEAQFEGDNSIGCPECGFHGHAFDTKEEARQAWNRRS